MSAQASHWKISGFKLVALCLAPLFALAALIWAITGNPRAQLREIVPTFDCEHLQIDTSSGHWSPRNGYRRASSSLRMPRHCQTRLQAMVLRDRRFIGSVCGLVDPCWTRTIGRQQFTLTFYNDYVGFRFSEH